MTPKVFGDNYVAEEVLGEGRAGIVYLCLDRKLNRRVALKVLRPELADAKELQRFLSEARILGNLSHENVVHVYDLDEKTPYIVMEYFPGITLRELCRENAPPATRALIIMEQVARGMEALHRLKIIHRDLSPNNILVGDADRAKVLDLGLARTPDMSSISNSGGFVGTVKYMSPETVNGHRVSFASDIFSFGSIFYELLAGENPFEAEHFMSVFYNIVERPHRPLREAVPNLPAPLHELVDACLAKEPSGRPPDMATVQVQLQGILVKEVLPASPVMAPRRGSTRSKRLRNPYLNRFMLKRAADFFGRSEEVERVFSRLESSQSVSIIGDRKIGKSSLLNFIYSHKSREEYMADPGATAMLFLDLQQLRGGSVADFVELLLGMAALELRGRVSTTDLTRDVQGIKDLAERAYAAGMRLVLLLDEFEAITSNPSFEAPFFSFLRSLVAPYDFAFVTSSAKDLQRLCHTKEIRDSPFFNVFQPLPLSVFRLEEALELITRPSAEVGEPLAGHADAIIEMAGLFPFFLQVACCHCVEFAKEHRSASLDFEDIRRRFDQEARQHYRFMWDGFDEHERGVILRVTNNRRIPDSLHHVVEDLERRRLLRPTTNQHLRVFSTGFHRFVESEIRRPMRPSRLRNWVGRIVR